MSCAHADYCEVNWNAEFVQAYEAEETRRRQQEQRQSYWQDHGHGPFGGPTQDPREYFQQVCLGGEGPREGGGRVC